jgi:hypothetical protein
MVYTSVLMHGGIVMQCANGSTYPGGPAHTSLLIGLNCYDILTNQTEQDLKAAWGWAERDLEAFQKAWLLVRKPFTDGKECCTEFGIQLIWKDTGCHAKGLRRADVVQGRASIPREGRTPLCSLGWRIVECLW